jgi:ankyrin repeat protein
MEQEMDIAQAISKYQYATVFQRIADGEKIPESANPYAVKRVYEKMVEQKRFDLLHLLIDRKEIPTDLYEYDNFRDSVLEMVIKRIGADEDSLKELEKLVGRFTSINEEVAGYTLLSYAVNEKVKPGIVQALINAGCDARWKNTADNNFLAQTINLTMMGKDDQMAYIHIFLGAGVDPAEVNVEKKNGLHLAAERARVELVQVLLDAGARPNEQDWKGNTPYYYAIIHTGGGEEFYRKLAAVEPPNFTLLNNARETLLSAYVRSMGSSEQQIALLEQMIDEGADLNQAAEYYSVPKTGWAWMAEKPTAVLQKVLNKTGRDVNEQDNDGNTLLHMICRIDCNYSHEAAKEMYKKIKMLMEAGADVGLTNNKDETAMMLASTDNLKGKIVELLLSGKK